MRGVCRLKAVSLRGISGAMQAATTGLPAARGPFSRESSEKKSGASRTARPRRVARGRRRGVGALPDGDGSGQETQDQLADRTKQTSGPGSGAGYTARVGSPLEPALRGGQ
jgi:hypothetical protein